MDRVWPSAAMTDAISRRRQRHGPHRDVVLQYPDGRPDLRWHDLRHTAVALAIAQGAHPKAIQERMGHASITITLDRYGHLFPALGRQVAEGLDRVYRESIAAPRPPCPVALTAKPSTSNQATVRTTLADPDGGPFQRQMTWDSQPASLGR